MFFNINHLKVKQKLMMEPVNLPLSPLNNAFDSLVLIFGKDEESRVMLKILLEMWHYRVKLIDEWEELDKTCQAEKSVLIVVDLHLPFGENLENVRQVRENMNFSNIPLIILSANSQPEFRETALELGADEFLVKPLDFNQLEICLKEYTRN
jgi:DNA-binding response OmpR family regulator